MSDIAAVVFTGRLGQDPEKKEVGSKTVTEFSIAQDQYNGKNKEKSTSWWRCECWSPAQALLEWVGKGDQVTVSGTIRQDQSEKDGKKITYYKVRVEEISLPPKADSGNKSDGERVRKEAKATSDDGDGPGW